MKKFTGILIVLLALAGCGKDGSTTMLSTSVTEATAPYVANTGPADFGEDVAVSTDISVTFSEPMIDTTIAIAVTDGTNTVTGTTVYGGRTALFTPGTELLPNTTYTVTVSSAAEDLDGNAMRADYSWQFTTGDLPPWTGIKQFGTASGDVGLATAVSGTGEVYVTGYTGGSLYGINAGSLDVFLANYDASGNQTWIRQFGTTGDDIGLSIAVSGTGEVYVAGYTTGSLYGTTAGSLDVFLAKYDASGNQTWIRQFGTTSPDYGFSVAVSGTGEVYVAGYTTGSLYGTNAGGNDVFLAKYDASGNQTWIRQFGSTFSDISFSVAVSGTGEVYMAGFTDGSLSGANAGGNDVFLAKYDASGNQTWIRQFGTTSHDYGNSVAVSGAGEVYVAGYTNGSLSGTNAGFYDVFLAKYNADGNRTGLWQIGSTSTDYCNSAAVSGNGDVYVAGYTTGSFSDANAGGNDIFTVKYDRNGNHIWSRQMGTSTDDFSQFNSLAVGPGDSLYVAGYTRGSFGGSTAGEFDAFVAKYDSAGNLQ